MMGQEGPLQQKLFYTGINLSTRVRADHPLRKISEVIDFDFSYEIVSAHYGANGNVSVPPPTLLKLMLLLVFYNVRSERELMQTLPERLDWLWFLGYDLDSKIPNHSVLSKARSRWGESVFREFFERVVWQCVEAGLVDGKKIFMDSSFIQANASNSSIVDTKSLKVIVSKRYKELESRLEGVEKGSESACENRKINKRYVSTTDPEAGIVRSGQKRLCYQTHRAVDEKAEVITAVKVTSGELNEAHYLKDLMNGHEKNTEKTVKTVVADSKYGTIPNYLHCYDKGVKAHIPDLKQLTDNTSSRDGIFDVDQFIYDKETDTCPAGKLLKRKAYHKHRESYEYRASPKDCKACPLKESCTRNKKGRSIKHHKRQLELNAMRAASKMPLAKSDLHKRQHLMERSFAKSTRYGFDQARWRGEWRVYIQELLTCTLENIRVLIKPRPKLKPAASNKIRVEAVHKPLFYQIQRKTLYWLAIKVRIKQIVSFNRAVCQAV